MAITHSLSIGGVCGGTVQPLFRRPTRMTEDYQAVIIGGGPAGSTAALMLAQANWSVAVVEKAGFPRRKVCGEYVSASVLPLLRRLGVAASFQNVAGPEVRQVGLFVNDSILMSNMPCAETDGGGWGRA